MKLARKKFGAIICCCWSVMSSEIKVKQTNALEKLRWAKQSDIQTVVLVEIVIHVTFWDVLMKCAQRKHRYRILLHQTEVQVSPYELILQSGKLSRIPFHRIIPNQVTGNISRKVSRRRSKTTRRGSENLVKKIIIWDLKQLFKENNWRRRKRE